MLSFIGVTQLDLSRRGWNPILPPAVVGVEVHLALIVQILKATLERVLKVKATTLRMKTKMEGVRVTRIVRVVGVRVVVQVVTQIVGLQVPLASSKLKLKN